MKSPLSTRTAIASQSGNSIRGTITFAPNFAFALATRAVTESQAANWDLSSMRALGCGAEPIQPDVLRGFMDRFAKHGLRPESILPSYGMAEATLAITFADVTAKLQTDTVDLESMRLAGKFSNQNMLWVPNASRGIWDDAVVWKARSVEDSRPISQNSYDQLRAWLKADLTHEQCN